MRSIFNNAVLRNAVRLARSSFRGTPPPSIVLPAAGDSLSEFPSEFGSELGASPALAVTAIEAPSVLPGQTTTDIRTRSRSVLPTPAPRRETLVVDVKPQRVSVADVCARAVPVHWQEAVAVMEALCSELAREGSHPRIPDPRDVVITAQGFVEVQWGVGGGHDVRGLGRMLHMLLTVGSPGTELEFAL